MDKNNNKYDFTLNLYNNRWYDAEVYVDGVKLRGKEKKSKYPMRYEYSTDNDIINVSLKKTFEINSSFYILKFLFYFIISIFGIFDLHEKRFRTMEVEFSVDLKNTSLVEIKFDRYREGKEAVLYDANVINMKKNVFHEDSTAKLRYKKLKIIKIFLTIAIIASLICVGINLIF